MKKIFKTTLGVSALCLFALLTGCTSMTYEERLIREGEIQKERLAEQQKKFEKLKSRVKIVCTPVVIPNYQNRHLNVASVKLAASCRRVSNMMFKYIAEREKEDNVRNVALKVFMNPDNFIETRPGRIGEFPRPDGTVQKMTPAEFAAHLLKVKKQIGEAAVAVMVGEQKKTVQDARKLNIAIILIWQMELAKNYVNFTRVMSEEERVLYRNELKNYNLWNEIIAGDRTVRSLTARKRKHWNAIVREGDTAVSVAKAVLIEIARFQKICESKHAGKRGWERNIAIAAEAARVAPYVAKVTEQSSYALTVFSYLTDEWALNLYDVEKDLIKE